MLPPWPGWTGLHPLIAHLPVGLLIATPIFVVLSALRRGRGSAFGLASLILLLLGTTAIFVAVDTGRSSMEPGVQAGTSAAAADQHRRLGETTRTVFAFLTLVYAALLILPMGLRMPTRPRCVLIVNGIFLILLAGGLILLLHTVQGGQALSRAAAAHDVVPSR